MSLSEIRSWQMFNEIYPLTIHDRLQKHCAKLIQTICNFSMCRPEEPLTLLECLQLFDPEHEEPIREKTLKALEETREKEKKAAGTLALKEKGKSYTNWMKWLTTGGNKKRPK